MLKRLVNGIECDIVENEQNNCMLFENFLELRDEIYFRLEEQIPIDIKNSIDENIYIDLLNQSIDYVVDCLKETVISNGTFIEDGLCYFYDLLEDSFEDKPDNEEVYYTMFKCTKTEHEMITKFAESMHILPRTYKDPIYLTIEEAVLNALERGVSDVDLVSDVAIQLGTVAEDFDFLENYVEDFMLEIRM